MLRSRTGKIFCLYCLFFGLSIQAGDKTTKSILTGRFNPAENSEYDLIPVEYALQKGMYMHVSALEAFKQMATEAHNDGFSIYIISALRDFSTQKSIWESKFNGSRMVEGKNLKTSIPDKKRRALKILEYSSMPGTSRHHWGTDIDIGFDVKKSNQMLTNTVYDTPEGKKFYQWMSKNASRFGFCQPYKGIPEHRSEGASSGYQEEKWHWSYQPLAAKYLKLYLKNAEDYTPTGFEGSPEVRDFFLDYVRNVSADCE